MYYTFFLTLILLPYLAISQQFYAGSVCPANDNSSTVLGYTCNGVNTTCQSFLTYITQPPYNTISSIATLLSANASQISTLNKIPENATLQSNYVVYIPITCSCSGKFYQVNTSYIVQSGDDYHSIANNTFEGLSTCNAIRTQKITPDAPFIYPNETLRIPLRCACPTKIQVTQGIKYLMSYVIQRGQFIIQIATDLGADVQQTLDGNVKSEDDSLIIPFTALLVPLRSSKFPIRPVPLSDHLNDPPKNRTRSNHRSPKTTIAISVPVTVIAIVLLISALCIHRRKCAKSSSDLEELIVDIESLKFEFKTIKDATDNFSDHNKLGQGGFGGVYKGKLENGQEIAVKRLSSDSGQGIEEFKTEVLLVAKLQHKNLVKLLGFCLHGDEKLLVYELLPNASLDKILLDQNRQPTLNWETRYKILLGTARGLLYLHEDSRLKIIHRDLKLSNILLDEDMNPKIGDFGLARLVGRDQIEAETSRIAGTLGYMAPEYFFGGRFSIMSDVYSFGIVALEIVTGHTCCSTTSPSDNENLCSRAWKLWTNGEISNLVDSRMGGNYIREEVKRCIQIGLLCIQEDASKRPMMDLIISALNGHQVALPEPDSPFLGQPQGIQNISNQVDLNSPTRVSDIENDSTEIYPR